jgi:hypothetical protein
MAPSNYDEYKADNAYYPSDPMSVPSEPPGTTPVSPSPPGNDESAPRPPAAPSVTTVTVEVVPDSGLQHETATPVSRPAWPSNRPIVVGEASPAFEPEGTHQEYRVNPCRPDTVIDGWSTGPFTVRAATTRGHLHRYNGSPRQDDYAIVLQDPQGPLIVAVADGVSAAEQSHIGATTAVRYASRWLAQQVSADIANTNWRALLENTAWALVERAKVALSLDEVDAERTEHAMATTLVCAVCQPINDGQMTVWLVGVGDSGAWVLDGTRYTQVLGGKSASEAGITSSAVVGLPRIPKDVKAVKVTVKSGQTLLVGTDGFGDPLGAGTGEVGSLFSGILGGKDIPAMLEFAHALDFSRETFDDDRTLVAVWPFHPSLHPPTDGAAPATLNKQVTPAQPAAPTSASQPQAEPDR